MSTLKGRCAGDKNHYLPINKQKLTTSSRSTKLTLSPIFIRTKTKRVTKISRMQSVVENYMFRKVKESLQIRCSSILERVSVAKSVRSNYGYSKS